MTISTTLASVAAARIDDLPPGLGGVARLARAGLGLTAFGVQIFDLPAGATSPPHDELHSGQEELYIALGGAGEVVVDGRQYLLDPDNVVAVAPAATRHLTAGPDALRVLCVGGTPGRAYEPPEWTEA